MSLDFLKSPVFMRVCAGCANGNEATAALDPRAEYEMYQNFNKMSEGKTTIFISHRLSSSRFCDKIAVFAGGEIKEYGSHDELYSKDGMYHELFDMQAKFYQ